MPEDEVLAFRGQPDWELALRLCRIDDLGKVPGAEVPGIDGYRGMLARVVAAAFG
jgi:hypothetical protein